MTDLEIDVPLETVKLPVKVPDAVAFVHQLRRVSLGTAHDAFVPHVAQLEPPMEARRNPEVLEEWRRDPRGSQEWRKAIFYEQAIRVLEVALSDR